MTRVIAILVVLAFAAAMASAATVRADDHDDNLLAHDLEKQREGKGKKAGGALNILYQEYLAYVEGEGSSEGFEPSNPLIRLVEDRVIIEAVADGRADDLDKDLKGLGLKKGKKKGRLVSGQFPLKNLNKLNGLGRLRFAQPSYVMTASGLVTSQGDEAMDADVARAVSGVDGTGVVVGVLSDSFNCRGGAAADQAAGDLPDGIAVLDEEDGCGSGTDEGRAMMQLIHDVAPGAGQAFHSAFNGQADFADGIVELATTGEADVIVDDVIYLLEPMFQDGVVAQAVDTVESLGVSYYSAAGNNARDSYESPFRSSGISLVFRGADAHDFNPGSGRDLFQRITVPPGSGFTLVFQWDEPYASVSGGPGSASDVDVFVTDDPPTHVLTGSAAGNIGGDPAEIFSFTNPTNSNVSTFNIVIEKFNGPSPGLMKYVLFARGPGVAIIQGDTQSGTVYGHANAAGAEAVGAAFYGFTPRFGVSPPRLEGFSSSGTTPILFETDGTRKSSPEQRQKPGIVAPDGTNTTFFGRDIGFDDDTFPNFFGTSAAAPHAAAVAALMLEMDPTLTPDAVSDALRSTAIDMKESGVDSDSGYGLIRADLAMAAVTPNQPPTADDDSAATPEETAVVIDVLANDEDADGSLDTVTVTVTTPPANGGTSVNTVTGAITFTPDDDFNGSDAFGYTVADDEGAISNEATVTINVAAVNDPPEAGNQTLTTDEDTPVAITLTGSDVDEDDLSFGVVSDPANGVLSGDAPDLTYTPNDDFNGSDSFTFTANDPSGATSTEATVSIGVQPVNDPPVVGPVPPITLDEGGFVTLDLNSLVQDLETPDDQVRWSGVSLNDGVAGVTIDLIAREATIHGVNDGGPVTIRLTATDGGNPHGCGEGLPGCSAPIGVDLDVSATVNQVAPTAGAGGPYSGDEGSPIRFDGDAQGPGSSGATFQWVFDYDGATFDVQASGIGLTGPTHAYPDDGEFTVALRLIYGDDDVTDVATALVTVANVAPIASAGGPYQGPVGSSIVFSGGATDPGDDTLTYNWDFDYDGQTFLRDDSGIDLTGPTHTYAAPGEYIVALVVTDEDGGQSEISTALVTQAPADVFAIVDIRPRSINLNSGGVTPVAVLANDDYDANGVDIGTLRFGLNGTEGIPAHGGHIEDLNGDGRDDLKLHIRTEDLGIPLNTADGTILTFILTGSLFNGAEISGQALAQIKVKRLVRQLPTALAPPPSLPQTLPPTPDALPSGGDTTGPQIAESPEGGATDSSSTGEGQAPGAQDPGTDDDDDDEHGDGESEGNANGKKSNSGKDKDKSDKGKGEPVQPQGGGGDPGPQNAEGDGEDGGEDGSSGSPQGHSQKGNNNGNGKGNSGGTSVEDNNGNSNSGSDNSNGDGGANSGDGDKGKGGGNSGESGDGDGESGGSQGDTTGVSGSGEDPGSTDQEDGPSGGAGGGGNSNSGSDNSNGNGGANSGDGDKGKGGGNSGESGDGESGSSQGDTTGVSGSGEDPGSTGQAGPPPDGPDNGDNSESNGNDSNSNDAGDANGNENGNGGANSGGGNGSKGSGNSSGGNQGNGGDKQDKGNKK